MTSENQFEMSVNEAMREFKTRLEQQRLFQAQDIYLRRLQSLVMNQYSSSQEIMELSTQYESFRNKLNETGRTYDHIVYEKTLVDIYSSFERFLSDSLCSIYFYFPKFIGETVNVSTLDLFVDSDIDLCKRNVIELKVKNFIQSKNIKEILSCFEKEFDIKKMRAVIDILTINKLYQIALIRNLIIHNNGMVNRIYVEQIKKFISRQDNISYEFCEGDSVLEKLPQVVDDVKSITTRLCEEITLVLISDAVRLKNSHENK